MIQSTETLTFEFYTHENMKKKPILNVGYF